MLIFGAKKGADILLTELLCVLFIVLKKEKKKILICFNLFSSLISVHVTA